MTGSGNYNAKLDIESLFRPAANGRRKFGFDCLAMRQLWDQLDF